jgi:hypothetical protein
MNNDELSPRVFLHKITTVASSEKKNGVFHRRSNLIGRECDQ